MGIFDALYRRVYETCSNCGTTWNVTNGLCIKCRSIKPVDTTKSWYNIITPTSLENFIGQSVIKKELNTILKATTKHNIPVQHILFSGGFGLGKSLDIQSYILTDTGVQKVKEVLTPMHATQENFNIASINGRQCVRGAIDEGILNSVVITTEQGYKIECTPETKIYTLDTDGTFKWKFTSSFEVGDYLPIQRGQDLFGTDLLSSDGGKLIGYLIADGCFHNKSFSKTNPIIVRDFMKVLRRVTDDRLHKSRSGNYQYHKITNNWLNKWGVKLVNSPEKEIPISVLYAEKNTQREFLRALFSCESWINNGCIEFSTSSENIAEILPIMLLNFGIICKKSIKKVKEYPNNKYWRISITGFDYNKFMDNIGVIGKNSFRTYSNNSQKDCIPYIIPLILKIRSNVTLTRKTSGVFGNWNKNTKVLNYKSLNKVLDLCYSEKDTEEYKKIKNIYDYNFFYDKVKTIEYSSCPMGDLYVPSTECFMANGFILHNTTLAKLFADQVGDYSYHLASNLTNTFPFESVVVLDEIHTLKNEELVLVNMDSGYHTVIGATTTAGSISSPLRSRFVSLVLEPYSADELKQIVKMVSKNIKYDCPDFLLEEIANRGKTVARTSILLFKRIYDRISIHEGKITKSVVASWFDDMKLDMNGLDNADRAYLSCLSNVPMGLQNISATTGIDKETITDMIEPFLLSQGYITRTARGRILSDKKISIWK